MILNEETQRAIDQFTNDEAPKYLDYAKITYFEKIGIKTTKIKNKFLNKIEKFKLTSDEIKNSKSDLKVYMTDYITDLIEQGYSEIEALKIAKENLKVQSETEKQNEITEHYIKNYNDKYMDYYLSIDPQEHEKIGLYYGGFTLLFGILGMIVGFILWYYVFIDNMFITILVSTLLGIILGVSLALLKHASTIDTENK